MNLSRNLNKYRVSVRSFSRNSVNNEDKCYIGISLNSPFFKEVLMYTLLEWIHLNCGETIIIIADYLNRHNQKIFPSLNNSVFDYVVKGNEYYEKLQKFIETIPANRFHLTRWQDMLNEPNYEIHLNNLKKGLSNKSFLDAIYEDSINFIKRQNKPMGTSLETAITISNEYILEELAVCSVLIEKGWVNQIYPGNYLSIFYKFADGNFPFIQSSLQDGNYINLKVKKKR